ncbi:hypothetical protein ACIQXI_14070 [Lysinibacillus sp. NPDC097195]|uniref:hypothetical protein n=1 Tax=Lysinibacillus sp. NPDC097195 TaxID=3364141 RepID=UPI0037F57ACC
MQKYSVLKSLGLIVLASLVIFTIYSFIVNKESFGGPIWKQVVMASCFLVISINNFRLKKYAMGWIFAGAVLAFGISIFRDTIAS